MDLMTVSECLDILEQYLLFGRMTNFARKIPDVVWQEMAANIRFAMMIADVSEEEMRRVMVTSNDRSPEISIEMVRRYLSEGGDLGAMLQAMRHCGFHPLSILRKDLRSAVRNDVLKATWKVSESLFIGDDATNMFLMIKRECSTFCAACGHGVAKGVCAKYCETCGLPLEQEHLEGLWQLLSRPIANIHGIVSDMRVAGCMQNNGLVYIGQLVQKSEGDLLKTRNFGRRSLYRVQSALGLMGLRLGMNVGEWKPPT